MTDAATRNYDTEGLFEKIEAGLTAIGGDPLHPTIEQLAMVDETHVRGPLATAELIPLMNVGKGDKVLDIGSGIGGSARNLASKTGATVVGVDISTGFCDVATTLTQRMGMSDNVSFINCAVEELDQKHGLFDAAWTIHVAMNVSNKPTFYKAIFDRLRSGATFVIYDVLAGNGTEVIYPAPWAIVAEESFLSTSDEMQTLLKEAGFRKIQFTDDTQNSVAFLMVGLKKVQTEGPHPLGIQLALGPRFKDMLMGLGENFKSGAIQIGRFVCVKP